MVWRVQVTQTFLDFFFSLTFLDLNISLQWHLLKVKSKSFTKAPAHPTPIIPPVLFCTPDMLASRPLHKLYEGSPASGSLSLPFPGPGMLFPQWWFDHHSGFTRTSPPQRSLPWLSYLKCPSHKSLPITLLFPPPPHKIMSSRKNDFVNSDYLVYFLAGLLSSSSE